MIHVVCGMIGAGKTTFCYRQECDVILDLDWIDNKNKYVQLESLLKNLDKEVYYTTCYPTSLELKTFDLIDNVEFLWINTGITQCSINILKRNRNDDLMFYKEKVQENILLQGFYLESDINFKVVDVFLLDEWWYFDHPGIFPKPADRTPFDIKGDRCFSRPIFLQKKRGYLRDNKFCKNILDYRHNRKHKQVHTGEPS
ncbi:MAG: hypothetical protein PHI41_06480 [Erysipelotrichaceae bacterium]|nr:hypothetical protein [Erysipelotrichaceae bacterium]